MFDIISALFPFFLLAYIVIFVGYVIITGENEDAKKRKKKYSKPIKTHH